MKKELLIEKIEEHAQLHLQAAWDSSGVQVDSYREEFSHLAITLDPTWQIIEKAIAQGADCILAHHPLSMSPYKLDILSPLYKSVHQLIKNDVLLYSAHTSLDSTYNGFSWWFAKDLNLQNLEELDEFEHFGFIGELEKEISIEKLVEVLEKNMPSADKRNYRLVGNNQDRLIKKVALCTGSGSSLYAKAQEKQADIFITGDLKYHQALDIINEISPAPLLPPLLLDVGHFSLEEEMMRRFAKHLESTLNIKTSFIEGVNPFSSLI